MGKPEGHHFLPRFYLKSFADGAGNVPHIWVHESGKPAKRLAVSVVAKQTHFYSIKDKESGEYDVGHEYRLGDFERYMAPVFEKVVKDEGVQNLTPEEVMWFAAFVILTMHRTPHNFDIADHQYKEFVVQTYKEGIAKTSDEEFKKIYEGTLAAHPEMQNVNFEKAKQWMLEGPTRDNVSLSHSAGIQDMWMSLADVLPFLMQMRWKFWVPGDGEFVTSDDPVVSTIKTPYGTEFLKGGWIHRSLEVTFPLSPRLCLVATKNGDSGRRMLTGRSVPLVNRFTLMMSKRFAYASRERTDLQPAFDERDEATVQSGDPRRITAVF